MKHKPYNTDFLEKVNIVIDEIKRSRGRITWRKGDTLSFELLWDDARVLESLIASNYRIKRTPEQLIDGEIKDETITVMSQEFTKKQEIRIKMRKEIQD